MNSFQVTYTVDCLFPACCSHRWVPSLHGTIYGIPSSTAAAEAAVSYYLRMQQQVEAFGWMGALGFCAAGPVGCWTWGLDEPAAVQSRMPPCSRPVVAGGLAFLVYKVLAWPCATVVFYLGQGERPPVMMIWSRSPTSVDIGTSCGRSRGRPTP
jgi:hypothetical protein